MLRSLRRAKRSGAVSVQTCGKHYPLGAVRFNSGRGHEVMTDYGTIKIPEPAYEYHNEQRQELGLTWEQYINSQEPEPTDVDMSKVLGRIDDLENQLPRKVAEEVRR